MATREQMRASDADREAAVERLHQAASEGRLAAQELEDRLTRAFAATTYGDLDALVDDLPMPVAAPPPRRVQRAGFWRRFGASFLDGLIVALVTGILAAIFHSDAGRGIGVLVSIGYFVYFEGSARGGGVGKQAFGIRVADRQTGGPIGYSRAFVRWVGRILSTIVFLLGFFWMLGDAEKQCWHDKLANDVVVFRDGRRELTTGGSRGR
jgi:uncharacterized RDD family membrane protein YckC